MDSKWFDLYKRKIICHHTEDLSWCEYKTNYRPYSFIGSGNKSILPDTRLSQVLKLLCIDIHISVISISIVYIETPVWEASYPFSLIWEASLLLMTCEHKMNYVSTLEIVLGSNHACLTYIFRLIPYLYTIISFCGKKKTN